MGAVEEQTYCPFCGNVLELKRTKCDLCGGFFSEKQIKVQINKQAKTKQKKTESKTVSKFKTRLKKVNKFFLTIAILSFLYGLIMVIAIPIMYFDGLTRFFPIFIGVNILCLILSLATYQTVKIIGILGIFFNLVALLIEVGLGLNAFLSWLL